MIERNMSPAAAVQLAERQLGVTAGYSVFHRWRWIKTLKYLEQACPPTTHPKLLDLGVWPGYQSLALQKMGYNVFGLDLDPSRLPDLPLTTKTFDLNQEDHFPVADHSLDVIVATEIIEHIAPQRLPIVLTAGHKALRAGGYLLITTPNRRHIGAMMKSRSSGTDAEGHGHTHEYVAEEVRALIPSSWQNVKLHQVDLYKGVGKITNQEYYRPLWQWWRHPRRVHNSLKLMSGFIQAVFPPVRDSLVLIARA